MEHIFAFDVDGTLTAPRQHIDLDFEIFLKGFVQSNPVYLVTGSDYSKIAEQLPESIMNTCKGVFTCSGAELWKEDKLVYRKQHTFPDRLIETVEYFIDSSPYYLRCGTHIEPRPGMLNISVVGRDATEKSVLISSQMAGPKQLLEKRLRSGMQVVPLRFLEIAWDLMETISH